MQHGVHVEFVKYVLALFLTGQDEAFLEDINMILNTGDVPNIYESDEKAEITEQVNKGVQSCDLSMRSCSKNTWLTLERKKTIVNPRTITIFQASVVGT